MSKIKNIVFDLGGVVFARKFEPEFIKFFSYIMLPEMPHFWEEYDRGVSTYEQVLSDLAEYNSCDRELAEKNLQRSILTQEEIPATKALIKDLKSAQYKLYVLSNMSLEFIEGCLQIFRWRGSILRRAYHKARCRNISTSDHSLWTRRSRNTIH